MKKADSGRFGKQEKRLLCMAAVLFLAVIVMLCLGREWIFLVMAVLALHAGMLLKVMMLQAGTIEQLIKDKEEYIQEQHRERLHERVNNLREDVERTRQEVKKQSEDVI